MSGRAARTRRGTGCRLCSLGALLALLALAPAGGARADGVVVPWVDEHPVKAAARPPLAPPCRASALQARLVLQGATGSLLGGVTLRNVGVSPCSLLGWPTVSLRGRGAARAKWQVKRVAAQPQPLDVLADPPGSLRALAPGKSAWVSLWWSNWCGPGSRPASGPGPPPRALELGLDSGTTTTVALAQAPRCDQPRDPSRLSVGPFTPTWRRLPESSRLPLRVAVLGRRPVVVKPGLRAFRVRRGERFRFVVAVTNVGSRPFRFGEGGCPTYLVQIDPAAAEAFVLNCRPVWVVAPHARVLFAMDYAIPTHLHLGFSSLTWQLAPRTYDAPFAPVGLWVAR